MKRLRLHLRRFKAEARDVLRYLDPRGVGNEVVRATEFSRGARPVLLLPGFMSTRRGLTVLERRLRRDGYAVFSLNLGGLLNTFNTRSIEETGLLVREKVERLYRRYDLGPLAIVGHSKGGLIGRYYLQRLGGNERACTLVTLGTPHRGTRAAYVGAAFTGLFAPSIWQLMPASPFIRRLNEAALPPQVRMVSIYSTADSLAPPPTSQLDPAERTDVLNHGLDGIAHHEFLTRKKVYDVVRRELAAGFRDALLAMESPLERRVRRAAEETAGTPEPKREAS